MNKLTITWFGAPKVFLMVNQDNFTSTYVATEPGAKTDLTIRHTLLKTRAPSGNAIYRHDVELKHRTFGTPTTFATENRINCSITTAEDTVSGALEGMVDAVGGLISASNFAPAMLSLSPLTDA